MADINPLTGLPYTWSSGYDYGSLDNALYGYEYTPFDSGAGDMGAPSPQWVNGALYEIANRPTAGRGGR